MIYSNACEYAIRALAHLVSHGSDARVLVRVVSQEEDIPGPFLGKIFQTLARQGILNSVKGPGGGFSLARPATEVTLYDVRAAIDGVEDLDGCAVGLARCSDEMPCPLHDTWKPIRESIRTYLSSTTLDAASKALSAKRSNIRKQTQTG